MDHSKVAPKILHSDHPYRVRYPNQIYFDRKILPLCDAEPGPCAARKTFLH